MLNTDEYSLEIYNKTLAALELRLKKGETDMQEIKAEYEALCTYQGHGMNGRGFYKEAEIQGQIDAYQVFIFRNSGKSS